MADERERPPREPLDIGIRPRAPDELRATIDTRIQVLHALYYLGQSIGADNREHLSLIRRLSATLPAYALPRLLADIENDIAVLKREAGCMLSDGELREAFASLAGTQEEGWLYIPKQFIDQHWFTNYQRIFTRWPSVPIHALVMFDANPNNDSPYRLWLAESALFEDVKTLWAEVVTISDDGKTFRTRTLEQQYRLHTFMRTTATTCYHFIEAYVNGLAFGVFQAFHSSLDINDHDFLAEWDSKSRRSRFVSFERKLLGYPTTCGKYLERTLDLKGDPGVEYLAGEGKLLRDGLTHPSPYVNAELDDPGKVIRIIQISPEQVRRLLNAAIAYVRKVEAGLGRDPLRSVPWLTDL